jgi:hypothetical protein
MLLGAGIEVCIEKELNAPALILIYSAIDTIGWLDSVDDFATRTSFINWVNTYLLKAKTLKCSAIDLYSARCGLLHTFTAESRLSSEKKALRIFYAWGTGSVQYLQRLIDSSHKSSEYVAVHVNDLYKGWQLGVKNFIEDLEKDHERKSRVYKKAAKFFTELGKENVPMLIIKLNKDDDT